MFTPKSNGSTRAPVRDVIVELVTSFGSRVAAVRHRSDIDHMHISEKVFVSVSSRYAQRHSWTCGPIDMHMRYSRPTRSLCNLFSYSSIEGYCTLRGPSPLFVANAHTIGHRLSVATASSSMAACGRGRAMPPALIFLFVRRLSSKNTKITIIGNFAAKLKS